MRRSIRSAKFVTATGLLALAIAALAVAVPSGSAQAPAVTTLSFYEPDAGSRLRFTDNSPKSPTKNLGSKRYRFSVGDKLTLSLPLFDRKGGTRLGRLYAEGTVVQGKTFANVAIVATGTYILTDGSQIAVQGYFRLSADPTLSVTGGTGRYEGARGHVSSTSDATSSTDTLTLLP